MKKVYTKPEIAVENFFLSERIASCAGTTVTYVTTASCANNADIVDELHRLLGIFADSSNCSEIPESGVDIDFGGGLKVCLHQSTSNAVFGS